MLEFPKDIQQTSNVDANQDKNTPSVTPKGWLAAIISPLPFFLLVIGANFGVSIPIEFNACFHSSVPVLFVELEIKTEYNKVEQKKPY